MTVIDLEPEQNTRSNAEAVQSQAEVTQEPELLQESHIIETYEAELSHPEHVCGAHCDHEPKDVIETANKLFDDVEVNDHPDHHHHDDHDHSHEHHHSDHGPHCQCPAHKATESAEKLFEAAQSDDRHDHHHHHHERHSKANENHSTHEHDHVCHAGCEHRASEANKHADKFFESVNDEHHALKHHHADHEHDHSDHGPHCQCPAHKATEQAKEIFTEQETEPPQRAIDQIELQNTLERQLEENKRDALTQVGVVENAANNAIKKEATKKSPALDDASDLSTGFLADSMESGVRENKSNYFKKSSIEASEIDATKKEDLAIEQVGEAGEIEKTIDLPTQDFASRIEDDTGTVGHEGFGDSPAQYSSSLENSEDEVESGYLEGQLTVENFASVLDNGQTDLLESEEITPGDSAEEVSYIEHNEIPNVVDEAPISDTTEEANLAPGTEEMLDIAQDNLDLSHLFTDTKSGEITENTSSEPGKEELESNGLPNRALKSIDKIDNPEQKKEIADLLEELIIYSRKQLEREKAGIQKTTSFDANTSRGVAQKVELLSRVFGIEQSQLIQILGMERHESGELIFFEESNRVLRGLKKRLSMELSYEFPSRAVSSVVGGVSASTQNLGKLILLILKKKTLISHLQTA